MKEIPGAEYVPQPEPPIRDNYVTIRDGAGNSMRWVVQTYGGPRITPSDIPPGWFERRKKYR